MRCAILRAVLLLTVAGCAQPVEYWVKPGASEASRQAALWRCDQQALARFPPYSLGKPGYFANHNTWCEPTSGGTNCTIIGSGYLPQARSEADVNAGPRDQAFGACMTAAGWHPADSVVWTTPPPMRASEVSIEQALNECEGQFPGEANAGSRSAARRDFNQCVGTRTRLLYGS